MVVVDKWEMMLDVLMGKNGTGKQKEGLFMVMAIGLVVVGLLPRDFLKGSTFVDQES